MSKTVNIEKAIELANIYGFEVNQVDKGNGGFFYTNENGMKVKVDPNEYTEEMKSLDFQLSNGFIILDELKGNLALDHKNDIIKGRFYINTQNIKQI